MVVAELNAGFYRSVILLDCAASCFTTIFVKWLKKKRGGKGNRQFSAFMKAFGWKQVNRKNIVRKKASGAHLSGQADLVPICGLIGHGVLFYSYLSWLSRGFGNRRCQFLATPRLSAFHDPRAYFLLNHSTTWYNKLLSLFRRGAVKMKSTHHAKTKGHTCVDVHA